MEKSDHYYLRKQRMKDVETPTISEAKKELGEDLANALFSTCPDPVKPYMGIYPLLKGAGNDLWISPSDILIDHVCLKPPLTDRHMKALSHQGIMMIGRDIEMKFWNQAELEKMRALLEQEEMLAFIAELEKRKAVAAARKEEQEKCEEEKRQMRIAFEERLQYELKQLEDKLRDEYEQLMIQQKNLLDDEWQLKLEAAVAETVAKLTEQFLKDLEAQEKELFRKFSIEIKKEQIKRKMDVKQVEECCQETFLQLKHELQCKNIANMMYILCMERRKCQAEREHMEADYQKQVQELQALVTEKEVEITKLTKDLDEKTKQVNLREECVLEILRQFQKFINFALRASPTQAEFLLSLEKMMMFELTKALVKTDKRHAKRLTKTLFPWKTESDTTSTTLSFKESLKSLRAGDHHACYNEIEPPESDRSCTSGDYLPAFHYDKHMYVREEFRNMMSQGIKLSPSSLIWNKDVEHLMQILRRSVTSIGEQTEEEEKVSELKGEVKEKQVEIKEELTQERQNSSAESFVYSRESPRPSQSRPPRRSIVYFRASKDEDDFLYPIYESSSVLNSTPSELYNEMSGPATDSTEDVDTDMIIEKDCCTPCIVARRINPPHKKERETVIPLIGTVNSLELMKDMETDLPQQDRPSIQHSATGILCAQDSLHKHRMSLKPTNVLLSSRESIDISEVIALKKNPRRSSSDMATIHRNSKDSESNLVNRRSSIRRTSRDSKIQFCLQEQPSLQHTPGRSSSASLTEKDILKMSKLSLARDSFIVHKQSLILKREASKASQRVLEEFRRTSQETLQLKKSIKPGSTQDVLERSSLKKPSKSRISNETSSHYTATKVPSREMTRSTTDLRYPTSKLTMSRDSLDLLRLQPPLSGASHDKHKTESKDSIEIKDGILGPHLQGDRLSPIIKLEDDGSRTVKMSHIEILPTDHFISTEIDEEEQSVTCSVFKTKELTVSDSPWLIYNHQEPDVQSPEPSRDNFLTKPNVAHVGGDKKATDYLQKGEEFTLHRASSLLSIFRKHPSLVKMFTSCTK